jgi:hypothetical protein
MPQKPPVWSRINREHALTRGLVGCWLFNEGGGAFAHDAVGGAYNRADLINGPAWVPGTDGRCLSFDGVDDYVKTTRNDFDLCANTGSPLTFVALINPALSGAAARQGIVNIGEFNDLNFSSVFMILSATGELIWSIDPAGTTASSGLLAAANKWQNVAMVRNASEVRFFLESNKAVVANASANGVGSDPIIIGGAARNGALGSFYFAGKIGFVMVYNRALSDGEVQQLFADPYALFAEEETLGFVAASGGALSAALTETVAATDAYSETAAMAAALAESAAASDAFSATAAFGSALSESVAAGDAWTATASFASSLAESVAATDGFSATGAFTASLSETVAASDTVGTGFVAAWTSSVAASDAVSATFSGTSTGAETAAATDSVSAVLQATGAMTETVTAGDSFTAVLSATAVLTETANASDGFAAVPGQVITGPYRIQTLNSETSGHAGSVAALLSDGRRSAEVTE